MRSGQNGFNTELDRQHSVGAGFYPATQLKTASRLGRGDDDSEDMDTSVPSWMPDIPAQQHLCSGVAENFRKPGGMSEANCVYFLNWYSVFTMFRSCDGSPQLRDARCTPGMVFFRTLAVSTTRVVGRLVPAGTAS
jgi:hypothetical protein